MDSHSRTAAARVSASPEAHPNALGRYHGKAEFRNEQFASTGYVGARVHDAGIAEEFLAAFHALMTRDDWHDPAYLDHWLVSPACKPAVLKFKSSVAAI